jgi:hypothetical protein
MNRVDGELLLHRLNERCDRDSLSLADACAQIGLRPDQIVALDDRPVDAATVERVAAWLRRPAAARPPAPRCG